MSVYRQSVYRKPARNPASLMLALGGILSVSMAMPAFAQSVDIDADGNVRVDAGDGTVIEAGAAGTGVRTHGATVEAGGQQNLSSRSDNYQTGGDNVQHTHVDSSQVNDAQVSAGGDGVVHVISAGGGRASTTINGRTITSSSESGGAVSYANQDLAGSNFSGQRLEGVTFANSILHGADFRDAILVGASFANADLDSVDFRGANLENATLANAVLSGARLDGATWIDGRVCSSGSVGSCR